jgi:hypothetical protein
MLASSPELNLKRWAAKQMHMERMMLKQQLQIAAFLAAALLSSSEANADGGRHAFANGDSLQPKPSRVRPK